MKYFVIVFCILSLSCKTTEKITIKIKPYLVKANYRDAIQLGSYEISAKNSLFVQSLKVDTAVCFNHIFNPYQPLLNMWKRKEIDAIGYNYRLSQIKKEDSLAFSNGHKISGLVPDSDTILDAEVKMLIGINKKAFKIFIIVDENNNNIFSDDRLVIIDTINYEHIFDTLRFKVANLSGFCQNSIISFEFPIMINQLSNSNKPKAFNELFNLNPWISTSLYSKGTKRINGKRIYFDIDKFALDLNYITNFTIVSHKPINRDNNLKNVDVYRGDYLKISEMLYHIDSFGKNRIHLSKVNKPLSTGKVNFSIPVIE